MTSRNFVNASPALEFEDVLDMDGTVALGEVFINILEGGRLFNLGRSTSRLKGGAFVKHAR
jgi:hypothetical protein